MNPQRPETAPEHYVTRAAAEIGVPVRAILGHGKTAQIVAARWKAMQAAHRDGYSATAIGRRFNRDHTSVLNALRKMEGAR